FGFMKSLNTLGGGMITTSDDALASRLRALVDALPLVGRAAVVKGLAISAALRVATSRAAFATLGFPLVAAFEAFRQERPRAPLRPAPRHAAPPRRRAPPSPAPAPPARRPPRAAARTATRWPKGTFTSP